MSPKVSHTSVPVFYRGRGGGRKIVFRVASLLSPIGPPQQSENSWLGALCPSLPWLPVFLFLLVPLLGAERKDGRQRPNHRSAAHPAASRALSLARRLGLVFHEVVRLSMEQATSSPQTSWDQQGKVIYAIPKGHCRALLGLERKESSAEDVFFLTSA